MGIKFPNDPSIDDIHVSGNNSYRWDGDKWVILTFPYSEEIMSKVANSERVLKKILLDESVFGNLDSIFNSEVAMSNIVNSTESLKIVRESKAAIKKY